MARVRRPLRLLLAGLVVTAVAPASAAPAAPHEAVVDLTFPSVPTAEFIHDYHQPRSGGRVHKGTDLMVPKHTPAYAAVDGTVCFITGIDAPEPAYGYMLSICGTDGRTYNYVHMNDDRPGTDDGQGGPEHAYAPGVHDGAEVVRGQLVGWIGDSGNAESTGSHLHFEVHDPRVVDPYGDNRIDPFFSLTAAHDRGDVGGGQAALDVPSLVRIVGGGLPPAVADALAGAGFPREPVGAAAGPEHPTA